MLVNAAGLQNQCHWLRGSNPSLGVFIMKSIMHRPAREAKTGSEKLSQFLLSGMQMAPEASVKNCFSALVTNGYYHYERTRHIETDALGAIAMACGFDMTKSLSWSELQFSIYIRTGVNLEQRITHILTGENTTLGGMIANLTDEYNWSRKGIFELLVASGL